MSLPQQPLGPKVLRYSITTLIVAASLWSASGLEITPERFLTAPTKIWELVSQLFPLDLSSRGYR